jgi:hypothetical protein
MLTYGVVLLHDNERPHTSTPTRTRALLGHFNWELFDHPPLALSDYHLFTCLKDGLVLQPFKKYEELMEGVRTWQISLTQYYKNLLPDKSGSIQAVTTLRSSLSMYTHFLYIIIFLISCLVNSSPEVTFRIDLVSTGIFVTRASLELVYSSWVLEEIIYQQILDL